MVDALVLGTSALGRESSSLSPSTTYICMAKKKASPRVAHINFNLDKEEHFLRYVKYLSSPFHIMWRNFLAGTFRGLGFILGSAAVVALLGFFITQILVQIPFFTDFAQAVDIWLQGVLESQ